MTDTQELSSIDVSQEHHRSEVRNVATLRDLRDEANMTVMELAVASNVSISTINRLELINEPLVTRRKARKVIDALSAQLGRKIPLESVEGLQVK